MRRHPDFPLATRRSSASQPWKRSLLLGLGLGLTAPVRAAEEGWLEAGIHADLPTENTSAALLSQVYGQLSWEVARGGGTARVTLAAFGGGGEEDWRRYLAEDAPLAEARVLGVGTVTMAEELQIPAREGLELREGWVSWGPLRVGRQRLDWGNGLQNPLDLWTARDPLDPSRPLAGRDAVRLGGAWRTWSGEGAWLPIPGDGVIRVKWQNQHLYFGGVSAQVHRTRTRWSLLNSSWGLMTAEGGDREGALVASSTWTLAGAEVGFVGENSMVFGEAGWVWAELDGDDWGLEREGLDHLRARLGARMRCGRVRLFGEGLYLGNMADNLEDAPYSERLGVAEGVNLAAVRESAHLGAEVEWIRGVTPGLWVELTRDGGRALPRLTVTFEEGWSILAYGWTGPSVARGVGGRAVLRAAW